MQKCNSALTWKRTAAHGHVAAVVKTWVKRVGKFQGVEFRSKAEDDARGDLWTFLDSCEEDGSIAASAEYTDFRLTRHGGGPQRT